MPFWQVHQICHVRTNAGDSNLPELRRRPLWVIHWHLVGGPSGPALHLELHDTLPDCSAEHLRVDILQLRRRTNRKRHPPADAWIHRGHVPLMPQWYPWSGFTPHKSAGRPQAALDPLTDLQIFKQQKQHWFGDTLAALSKSILTGVALKRWQAWSEHSLTTFTHKFWEGHSESHLTCVAVNSRQARSQAGTRILVAAAAGVERFKHGKRRVVKEYAIPEHNCW